ncbi:YfhD family protein [Paenibacillus gansuensis]|uniref:YfhD family protein n=1 Tax=Paenibacillus gansuensis TaxID=306542 RepID=A0ABW5PCV7_9BACL
MSDTYNKRANFNISRGTGHRLPVSKNEDVEYSDEIADGDDREARERAAEADQRQEK